MFFSSMFLVRGPLGIALFKLLGIALLKRVFLRAMSKALAGAVLSVFPEAVSRVFLEAVLKAFLTAVLKTLFEAASNEATHCKVELPAGHSPERTAKGQCDPNKEGRHSRTPVSQASVFFEGLCLFTAPILRLSAAVASFFIRPQPPAAAMTPMRSKRREAPAALRIEMKFGVRIIAVPLAAMRVP